MANKVGFPRSAPVDWMDSKMGQANFVSGNATVVLLRMRYFSPRWPGADGKLKNSPLVDRDADPSNGAQVHVLVGAGIRTASVAQDLNVTQETGLGHFDIIETVTHNVASNVFTLDKMMLRYRHLSKIGVAPFGTDAIRSPLLDAVIIDSRLRTGIGANLTYARLEGLHIQGNRQTYNTGSTVMENCTFRFDRFGPFADSEDKLLPLMTQLETFFPHVYQVMQFIQDGYEYVQGLPTGGTNL